MSRLAVFIAATLWLIISSCSRPSQALVQVDVQAGPEVMTAGLAYVEISTRQNGRALLSRQFAWVVEGNAAWEPLKAGLYLPDGVSGAIEVWATGLDDAYQPIAQSSEQRVQVAAGSPTPVVALHLVALGPRVDGGVGDAGQAQDGGPARDAGSIQDLGVPDAVVQDLRLPQDAGVALDAATAQDAPEDTVAADGRFELDAGLTQDLGGDLAAGCQNELCSRPLGTFAVVNRESLNEPICFNVWEASTQPEVAIIQWGCGSAPFGANEQFTQLDMGNGRFMLRAVVSGLCLTIRNGSLSPGEILVQSDCYGLADQQFAYQPTRGAYGNIIAEHSGLCLTISGTQSNVENGLPIVQDTCVSGQSKQEFSLRPFDVVTVVNRDSATFGPMCFNVRQSSPAEGTAIIQWTCGPQPVAANMQFWRLDQGNGLFSLQSVVAGKCVTVKNDSLDAEAPMVDSACGDRASQQFRVQPTSDGFGNLVAQNSGLCLTVSGGVNSIYSGNAIVQRSCTPGETTQEFILIQQQGEDASP